MSAGNRTMARRAHWADNATYGFGLVVMAIAIVATGIIRLPRLVIDLFRGGH